MRQDGQGTPTGGDIARYFGNADRPSQQETLGQVVIEILSEGKSLNRTTLCAGLLFHLDAADSPEQEKHYHELIRLLFTRGAS